MGRPRRLDTVTLDLPRDRISLFFPMLQRGVEVVAQLGRPLKDFLCLQLGIDDEYVTGRITTIFLDNHPVDDLHKTLIREGSRLTLSGAMPGLVGATMRRSGFYAAFRQGISHAETGREFAAGEGVIRLKLFNLLLPELTPLVLSRGILLERSQLESLLDGLGDAAGGVTLPARGTFLLTVSFSGEL